MYLCCYSYVFRRTQRPIYKMRTTLVRDDKKHRECVRQQRRPSLSSLSLCVLVVRRRWQQKKNDSVLMSSSHVGKKFSYETKSIGFSLLLVLAAESVRSIWDKNCSLLLYFVCHEVIGFRGYGMEWKQKKKQNEKPIATVKFTKWIENYNWRNSLTTRDLIKLAFFFFIKFCFVRKRRCQSILERKTEQQKTKWLKKWIEKERKQFENQKEAY